MRKTIIIAFHLPQYHPIPENSAWWGAGFTEWRNVAKARPLFCGHRQPNLPGELGFYDLRLEETQAEQAELASWGGITAFCYYHYWFSGRLLLERPLELLLDRKRLNLPFCLCWANEHWTGHWAGTNELLVEQTYPGKRDEQNHYQYLRRFFSDPRYLRVDGKPVFTLFRPNSIPDLSGFVGRMRTWAQQDGIGDLYLIAHDTNQSLLGMGFDALAPHSLNIAVSGYLRNRAIRIFQKARGALLRYPRWTIDYEELGPFFQNHLYDGVTTIPTAIPNWDNTPRVGQGGLVFTGCSPMKFALHLRRSAAGINLRNSGGPKILLIKSWNEWAEGNYLEPDLTWGREWLLAVKEFESEMNHV